jgi:photosystem II stability/assembly factor-like uncharacterized protein
MRRLLILVPLVLTACAGSRPETPRQPTLTWTTSGTDRLLIGLHAAPDGRTVWASGAAGTWLRSTDGGTTWTGGTVPGADTLQFRDVEAFGPREAVLLSIGNGAASRLYRTADAGRTWTNVWANNDPDAFYDCMAFEGNRGFAFSDAVPVEGGPRTRLPVIETTDRGRTWTQGLSAEGRPGEGGYASSGTCALAFDGRRYLVTNGGDGPDRLLVFDGTRWSARALPVRSDDGARGAATLARSGRGLVAGLLGEIDSVTVLRGPADTGAWRPLGRTTIRRIYGLASSADGERLVAVGPDGLDVSGDGGRTWQHLAGDNLWTATALPNGTFLVAGQRGRIGRVAWR